MNAKKCDRCGKFYMSEFVDDEHFNTIKLLRVDSYFNSHKGTNNGRQFYELCPDCVTELEAFLNKYADS